MHRMFYCGFCLLFASGLTYTTEDYRALQQPLLLAGLFVTGVPGLFLALEGRGAYRVQSLGVLCYFAFCGLLLASSAVNRDWELALGAAVMLVLFICCSYLTQQMLGGSVAAIIFQAIVLTHMCVIAYSLFASSFTIHMPYRGIFYNPNSMGGVAATLFTVLVAYLYANLEDWSWHRSALGLGTTAAVAAAALTFALTVVTLSRGSVVTAAIVLLLAFGFALRNAWGRLTRHVPLTRRRLGLLIGLIAMAAIACVFATPLLSDTIISKHLRKAQGGSVDLNYGGRMAIWEQSLHDATLWGNGRDYFTTTDLGAHNTYVSLLGQYGAIPLAAYLIVLAVAAHNTMRFAREAHLLKYRYVPVFLLVAFGALSMVEGMIFKPMMIAAWSFIAYRMPRAHRAHVPRRGLVRQRLSLGRNR